MQMATINTAEHFGLTRDIGMIAPGRFGDIVLVDDLQELSVYTIISMGKLIYQAGHYTVELPAYPYPDWVLQSVHLGHPVEAMDFCLPAPGDGTVEAHVIEIIENQAPTKHLKLKIIVKNGEIPIDIEKDIAKVAVVERHKATGGVQVGLVHGFGFKVPCAIATTVAHDSHHMIVVGTSEADMAMAANQLARMGGGQIVVRQGKVVGQVELPIAGLMSNERAEVVAKKASTVLNGFKECGCMLNNPNMQVSLLALVVIPELRISDLGLVDVTQFKFIPVIEK
jgi:adenine deaminase